MNAYQNKWIEILTHAHLPGWIIEETGEDIDVTMPEITDLKIIRDNLPETIGLMALDINLPKERIKFNFRNGHETFEYVLNPNSDDLN